MPRTLDACIPVPDSTAKNGTRWVKVGSGASWEDESEPLKINLDVTEMGPLLDALRDSDSYKVRIYLFEQKWPSEMSYSDMVLSRFIDEDTKWKIVTRWAGRVVGTAESSKNQAIKESAKAVEHLFELMGRWKITGTLARCGIWHFLNAVLGDLEKMTPEDADAIRAEKPAEPHQLKQ